MNLRSCTFFFQRLQIGYDNYVALTQPVRNGKILRIGKSVVAGVRARSRLFNHEFNLLNNLCLAFAACIEIAYNW